MLYKIKQSRFIQYCHQTYMKNWFKLDTYTRSPPKGHTEKLLYWRATHYHHVQITARKKNTKRPDLNYHIE